MKTKTIAMMFGMVLMLSFASALIMTAGNSYSFESEEFEYYEVIGNSSDMQGMNISWINGNTTITFDIGFKEDNFTIVLFNIEKEVITEHHYSSGGGGTRTVYRDREVVTTEYINETINITEIKEIEIVKSSKILLILAILLLISAFILIIILLKKKKEKVM